MKMTRYVGAKSTAPITIRLEKDLQDSIDEVAKQYENRVHGMMHHIMEDKNIDFQITRNDIIRLWLCQKVKEHAAKDTEKKEQA